MAGWAEALTILGAGAAGGFKAAGEAAEAKMEAIEKSALQTAMDKRDENLLRYESKEARLGRESEKELAREEMALTKSEGLLGRQSSEKIAAMPGKKGAGAKTGAFEQKWGYISAILGEEKAKELLETAMSDTGKKANDAKLKVDTLFKAQEMRDLGASDEDINAVLKEAGLPEWVRTKTGDVSEIGGWFGVGGTETPETTFGPRKGLTEPVRDTSIDALFSEADQKILQQARRGGDGYAGTWDEKKPSGLLTPTQQPDIGREELGDILGKPRTYRTGPAEPYEIAPGEAPSLKERIQGWAAQTQAEGGAKFGEGTLETAIRQSGLGKELAQIKDMADNLRRQYPKMSDDELVQLVQKIAAGEQP